MKRQVTVHVCDVCHSEFEPKGKGTIMIEGPHAGGNWQRWPVEDGEPVDVCRQCCLRLAEARRMGLIEFDDGPLWDFAGFKNRRGLWHR